MVSVSTIAESLQGIASLSLALVLGGVAGGITGAAVIFLTWLNDARARTLRELSVQGLEIHKLREGYLLEGASASSTSRSPKI